jgi:hypothetical protein
MLNDTSSPCSQLRSDSDGEEDRGPVRAAPAWSHKDRIWEAALRLQHINPEKVFGPPPRTVDLEEMFPEPGVPTGTQRPFRKVSIGWAQDRVTAEEIAYYESRRNFKPI